MAPSVCVGRGERSDVGTEIELLMAAPSHGAKQSSQEKEMVAWHLGSVG